MLFVVAACKGEPASTTVIQTETVRRRPIVVSAEATGIVEPVNVVEVKSKASGQITRMTVETGSEVQPGDLLVQLDTRDVDQQWEQAKADRDAARSRLDVALSTRERQRALYQQRVITEAEFQQGLSDSSSAHTAFIRADAQLNLAEQRRDDATVRAAIAGTIIEKTVSIGSVITSSTGSMGAGTTLLKMADLSRVRVRAHFNETDIGSVQPGLAATVTVDAFPDQPFRGQVEKIEPSAIVEQSVTMFPVLISIDNTQRRLMPGMNGEVAVLIAERSDVLAIPSDAIRNPREAEIAARLLDLDPAAVRKEVDAQMTSLGTGTIIGQASGDVELSAPGFQEQAGRTGGQRSGRQPMPTAEECAPVQAAFTKNPRAKATIDSLRASMMAADDREAIMTRIRERYTALGVDATLGSRCARLLSPQRSPEGGTPAGGQGGRSAGTTTAAVAPSATQGGAGAPSGGRQGGRGARNANAVNRTGLVFVTANGSYAPRVVRLGLASYDYTEVTAGIEEGETVVLLTSAQLQQQQQQQRDQIRARQGGPLGTPAGGGGGGRGRGGD